MSSNETGAALVVALVAVSLLLTAAYILASRSFWYFTGALKSSDFKNARAAAEYGASEITNTLNQDGSSYLLVVQPPCWQSSDIDTAGIYMPGGAKPAPNKIAGVATNPDVSKRWKIIGSTTTTESATAISSGNYARYQLIDYKAPRRSTDSTDLSFANTCPSTASEKFANRFGGSAYLTLKAEVYRKGTLASQHTITQEVHVKGQMASSTGETSIVLASGSTFNTTTSWLDLDDDETKDANEPWLDIFCLYCTGSTQEELRTQDPPVGVGFQGAMASSYGGTIVTGQFIFPPFRFSDTNKNGIQDLGELPIPKDLYDSLTSKATSWSASPLTPFSGGGEALSNKMANSITVYSAETGGTDTGARAKVEFCASNGASSKTPPCSSSVDGDIQQITQISGDLSSSDLADGKTGWLNKADICTSLNISASYCTSNRIGISISLSPSIPDLVSGSQWYPYATGTAGERLSTYVKECADAVDQVNGKPYIGCRVNRISLDGGNEEVIVATNNTGGKPVYIFVQQEGDAIEFNGTQALKNQRGNDPDSLAVFGLPPQKIDPSEEVCSQTINLSGTDNFNGIWAWLPRGSVQSGVGTAALSGILWVCDFDGRGNFKFMGSKFSPSQGDCGINLPCGIYKYRAQGIAQINRL
jgi:hypothetical protein